MNKLEIEDKLTCFLYLLGRDHIPLGVIEEIMQQINRGKGVKFLFSNRHLAKYAQEVNTRLTEEGK